LHELISPKGKSRKSIGCRGTDYNQKENGAQRIKEGVKKDGGYIGIDPGLLVILPVETGGKQLIGKDLLGGGKAGQNHPTQQNHGEENPNQKQQISRG
jgi:hypothetical protein